MVAFIDDVRVYLTSGLAVLERDHPRRRFVSMMALLGREMQRGPDAEPYDDARVEFYARTALVPHDEFLQLDDGRSDAALAERFNVPLSEIAAKRNDLALPPRRRWAAPR